MHNNETDDTSGQVEPVKPKRHRREAGHGGPAKGKGWGGPAKGMPARGERAAPFGKGNTAASKRGAA